MTSPLTCWLVLVASKATTVIENVLTFIDAAHQEGCAAEGSLLLDAGVLAGEGALQGVDADVLLDLLERLLLAEEHGFEI